MAVFLSPGVFTNEIDLSLVPNSSSGIIPAFIGTAKRGPINEATFISNAQTAIDTFGEPFEDSNLMYSVLGFLEEGGRCWVLRVGVECEDGQESGLASVCIDTSGNKVEGWGRIPVFTGIDYGEICLRTPSDTAPVTFHAASVENVLFTDEDSSSFTTDVTVTFDDETAYTGAIDDVFTFLVTGDPVAISATSEEDETLDGATYVITRNSDGVEIASGTLDELDGGGQTDSANVDVTGTGLSFSIVVNSGALQAGDTVTFEAVPDNRQFIVDIEGQDGEVLTMAAASHTTTATLVTALNVAIDAAVTDQGFAAVNNDGAPCLRTDTAGERIQIVSDILADGTVSETDTEAFALEVGVSLWTYDIPRSHVIGTDTGPYNIGTNNNRVSFLIVEDATSTEIEFSLATGTGLSIDTIVNQIQGNGVDSGDRYFESFALRISDDDEVLVVATDVDHQFGQLTLQANASNIESLRFAEQMGVGFPYTNAYRVFNDIRVEEPTESSTTSGSPLSCDTPVSDASQCALDSAYYSNIVGYLVAATPGTWVDGVTVDLQVYNNTPGKFIVTVSSPTDGILERVEDVSFDPDNTRYIANLINPGGSLIGNAGNRYINWVPKLSTITTASPAVRVPGTFGSRAFVGQANGIPESSTLSTALDAAVIGNPNLGTGLNAFSNPEAIDISLLCIPGFTSGSVIAQGLQLCETRGDTLYLVDPPFGLEPQEVVDWHNGMLYSDLTTAVNSSYGALYWSWIEIFDQFAAENVFVPPSGHVAAVYARTERVAEPWFAPAGLVRGQLNTALDVEVSPTAGQRDLLYGFNNAVNPIVNFPEDGIVVYGQRTLQRADTALDRVNVRMLLIQLKKSLISPLRQFLFEPNDRFLWARVTDTITPLLRDVANRRGVTGYKVVVDETNNTPERIDRNELWVSVFVRPTRAAEFVVLNLAILRSDAAFASEATLQAAGVVLS